MALLATVLQAQRVLEVTGFRLADHYPAPNETRMKSLLQGGQAQPLNSKQTMLRQGVKLETFRVTGERELLVETPECLYDSAAQSASSAGPLRVQTADGKFTIQGNGFLWQRTNSSLIISNNVHTAIAPELLEPSRRTGNARTNAAGPGDGIEIAADRFAYEAGPHLATYDGDVLLVGTNRHLMLKCGTLTVELPAGESQQTIGLENITAERSVVLDYAELHATGERAIYSAKTTVARVTGHPAWQAGLREGSAEELMIDRTNHIFQANNHAWLKLPAGSLGATGLFGSSNAAPAGELRATNQFVDIHSGNYEFRTNWAVFREGVQLVDSAGQQTQGQLSCRQMTVTFNNSNELQRLVAEQNVRIVQETNLFTGGHAVYNGTNGILELTENPTWQAGEREGRGNLVRLNTQTREMLVVGNAFMRLPANDLGESIDLGPGISTNAPPKAATPPQFAEIRSERYTVRPGAARFEGGVTAIHPQTTWRSDTLTVLAPGPKERVVLADKGVVFTLVNDKGQTVRGLGNQVVYTNKVTGNFTNDIVTLIGNPAHLETSNITNDNNVIVFDRARNTFSSSGNYRITGTAPAIPTNMFRLPKR
jgi:lipopolysaccharide export system protein LptA